MTTRRRVTALLAVAALVGLTPAPASAEGELAVTLSEPKVEGATVTVAGEISSGLLALGSEITSVAITVVPEVSGLKSVEAEACPCGRPDSQNAVRFSKRIPVSANGRYTARVKATGKGLLGQELSGAAGPSKPFDIAAPPRAPQNLRVEVSPERIVTVSWDRNTEPDMLHYVVSRKDPGGDSFRLAGEVVKHPASGERVSFVDRSTAAAGGDYTYKVAAFRQGATQGKPVSAESDARSASVPAPAPGDPAAAPSAGASGLVGGFPAAQPRGSAAGPAPRPLIDTGFSETLPFGARPPGEEIEEGEQEPRSLEVGTTTTEFVTRGRPLVPIAAGAVLLLLAVHLRLLNKRVKAAPASVSGPAYTDLAPLDDDGFDDQLDRPVVQPRPVEPTPAPEPSRMQPPAAALFDYEHEQPVRPVPDEDWAEREWEDEIREVDAEIREVVVARSR